MLSCQHFQQRSQDVLRQLCCHQQCLQTLSEIRANRAQSAPRLSSLSCTSAPQKSQQHSAIKLPDLGHMKRTAACGCTCMGLKFQCTCMTTCCTQCDLCSPCISPCTCSCDMLPFHARHMHVAVHMLSLQVRSEHVLHVHVMLMLTIPSRPAHAVHAPRLRYALNPEP
jgi:hypothetical protein